MRTLLDASSPSISDDKVRRAFGLTISLLRTERGSPP